MFDNSNTATTDSSNHTHHESLVAVAGDGAV